MLLHNLDMDALRTLVVANDAGGFMRAAPRLGRTRSAVSLQMRRLQDAAGAALFRKRGRRLLLTDAGERVLAAARRILALNDALLSELQGRPVEETLRLGLPQDVAEEQLPRILARFGREHPHARVQARVDRSAALDVLWQQGQLDLAVRFSDREEPGYAPVAELPLRWIGGPRLPPRSGPLPLVLFEAPCVFRKAALEALDAAGRPWRVVYTSPSLSGLWAAVAAGLGVTVRTSLGLPRRVRALPQRTPGLPPLPRLGVWMAAAAGQKTPALLALQAQVAAALG